jgi:copper chaperone
MSRSKKTLPLVLLLLAVALASCGGGAVQPSVPINVTFEVEGMTCGSCEKGIVSALMALDGVSSANATHSTGVVEATVDPSRSTPEQMAAAIDRLGFTTKGWTPQE